MKTIPDCTIGNGGAAEISGISGFVGFGRVGELAELIAGNLKTEWHSAHLMKDRQNRDGNRPGVESLILHPGYCIPVAISPAPVLPVGNALVRTLHHCQGSVE